MKGEAAVESYKAAFAEFSDDGAPEAHAFNLTFAMGVLFGAGFPASSAAVAVAIRRLYPDTDLPGLE